MEKLLKFLVQSIVQDPEAVEVKKETRLDQPENINLTLKVNPEDVKIVIGKHGRTIKALRHLLRVVSIKQKIQFNLELEADQKLKGSSLPEGTESKDSV